MKWGGGDDTHYVFPSWGLSRTQWWRVLASRMTARWEGEMSLSVLECFRSRRQNLEARGGREIGAGKNAGYEERARQRKNPEPRSAETALMNRTRDGVTRGGAYHFQDCAFKFLHDSKAAQIFVNVKVSCVFYRK